MEKRVNPLPEIKGGWRTVYVDAPWPEYGGGRIVRGAQAHYTLMSLREIERLPVKQIVAKDAHLYLWVTNNFLPGGIVVMQEWGFRYVTNLCWPKPRFGLGQYFRGQHELCLFGVRGLLPYKILEGKRAQHSTLLQTWLGEHSQKPSEMYDIIEHVSYPPYLELFARTRRPGWTSWGRELPDE